MNNVWFTSDHHFGHSNILTFQSEQRPFATLEEMHAALIMRWNEVVKQKDTVYHLGDFCFGRQHIKIASLLNGRKNLIMGNHDHYPMAEYLPYFNKVMGAHYWKQCVLTHIPVHPDNLGTRAFMNIHGHLHGNKVKAILSDVLMVQTDKGQVQFSGNPSEVDNGAYFNVCVEQNNLYPFHSDQIMERLRIFRDHYSGSEHELHNKTT